jgi:enterochelin esterase-like enzyme
MPNWLLVVLGLLAVAPSAVAGARGGGPDPNTLYQLGPDSLLDTITRLNIPQGRIIGPAVLPESRAYPGTIHTWWLYVPAQYDPAAPSPLMVFQDGQAFVSRTEGNYRIPNVLDILIHRRELPVMVAVFINPGHRPDQPDSSPTEWGDRTGNRPTEYNNLDDLYARVVIDELLPEVRKLVNISDNPDHRGIGGASSGAIAAFTVAWQRPDQFRKVISTIGSFVNLARRGPGGSTYPDLIRAAERKPLRLFLQDGANDNRSADPGRDWFGNNLRMVEALTAKGYDVNYVWGVGTHDNRHGGAIMPEMLRWLWRDHPRDDSPEQRGPRAANPAAALAPLPETRGPVMLQPATHPAPEPARP